MPELNKAEQARHDDFARVTRRNKKQAQTIDRKAPAQMCLDGLRTTEQKVRDERARVKAIFRVAAEDKI